MPPPDAAPVRRRGLQLSLCTHTPGKPCRMRQIRMPILAGTVPCPKCFNFPRVRRHTPNFARIFKLEEPWWWTVRPLPCPCACPPPAFKAGRALTAQLGTAGLGKSWCLQRNLAHTETPLC